MLNEVQQFLQSAVHDLRAAQRRTAVASELLLQCADDRERADLSAQMLQGLSKTEELLAGIGGYANAITPHRYVMTVFPSSRAVRFALANLDLQIRETGATITVSDLPDLPGDRDRLAELFEHLIGNSLKFKGPDPPGIVIGATLRPEGWLFSITDNGMGIPPKYRDRLFIPFRRLQGSDVPGAGLGLAISKKIVEAHGGRIWIEAREGPGVTFCFLLPAGDGD
ncbi:MAG TPA: ATP-binding protein [Bryobacteraceae bacterium]|nr:ATP-binding protein [Bryobacteraceae bacterium]